MSSRHSSRHHSSRSSGSRHQRRGVNDENENLIEQCKTIVTQIDEMLAEYPSNFEAHIPGARSVMSTLDRIHFFRDASRVAEQNWLVAGLQELAYHDPDNGSIGDIATWCQASFLKVLRNAPNDADALSGLGENWLQAAQPHLCRIHSEDNSSETGSPTHTSDLDDFTTDEMNEEAQAAQRIQSQFYVEARGYLQPAADFYKRAVRASESSGSTTGKLLSSAAEAHMCLGNVSSAAAGQPLFERAVRYLRRAASIPGYVLSNDMQQWLDSYGRYVN